MKKYFLLFAILCAALFSGCGSDEPENSLFRLSFSSEYSEEDNTATFKVGSNYINVDLDGFGQSFIVTVDGNYETFTIAEGAPEWASATAKGNQIVVDVKGFGGPGNRTGKINFVVFKGSNSETGYIQISQKALTYEEILAQDRKAVKKYLSQFKVIETLPADNNYQTGSDAPYYKLNAEGTVYMQVISLGSMPPASEGDRVYFRYMRYNLLDYYTNGHLSEGWGNANSLDASPAYFVVGSTAPATTQWGIGIPLPIQLGLPVDSRVNLVISSDAGITNEIASVIPFLYNIQYFRSQI